MPYDIALYYRVEDALDARDAAVQGVGAILHLYEGEGAAVHVMDVDSGRVERFDTSDLDGDRAIDAPIVVSLDDLITAGGVDGLNDIAERHLLENGALRSNEILSDIGYEVMGAAGENTVQIRVIAKAVVS